MQCKTWPKVGIRVPTSASHILYALMVVDKAADALSCLFWFQDCVSVCEVACIRPSQDGKFEGECRPGERSPSRVSLQALGEAHEVDPLSGSMPSLRVYEGSVLSPTPPHSN